MNDVVRERDLGRAVLGLSLTMVIATLSACSSAPEVPVSERAQAALSALSTLPPELNVARGIIVRECLKSEGFGVPFDSADGGTTRAVLSGVVGVQTSEQTARAAGYGTTIDPSSISELDEFGAALPISDGARFEIALWGSGSDMETLVLANGAKTEKSREGCWASGDVAVYGSVIDSMRVEMFTNEVTTQSASFTRDIDNVLGDKLPAYERCMSEFGYDIAGLGASEFALREFGEYRTVGTAPNEAEQALAVQDFRCQDSAGIPAALLSVFNSKASVWIAENESEILELQEVVAESVDRATSIINAG